MKRTLSILSIIIASMVLIISGCTSATPACPMIGDKAPDFTLKTADGGDLSLSDFRGKTVMLNLWSTRCGPCVMEMPLIQELYAKRSNQGLVVLAINVSDDAATAQGFASEYKLTFPILLDPQMTIHQAYCLQQAIPITLFIDADGIYSENHVGMFQSLEQIESKLDPL